MAFTTADIGIGAYQRCCPLAVLELNQGVAGQYGIRSIPTLLVFKGGRVVDQIVGAVPKKILAEKVSKHLG